MTTGNVIENAENGKQYGCRECMNTDHVDDCVILFGIDTEHHVKLEHVKNMVEGGNHRVIRELYGAYPFSKKQIVNEGVRR